jgi:hypothetical protein
LSIISRAGAKIDFISGEVCQRGAVSSCGRRDPGKCYISCMYIICIKKT